MDSASAGRGQLPVACELGPDDGPERMRRWQRLGELAQQGAVRTGGRLEVSYRAERGVREELAALAAAERVCCPFVAWEVHADQGTVVLRVTAPDDRPDDVVPVAALFDTG